MKGHKILFLWPLSRSLVGPCREQGDGSGSHGQRGGGSSERCSLCLEWVAGDGTPNVALSLHRRPDGHQHGPRGQDRDHRRRSPLCKHSEAGQNMGGQRTRAQQLRKATSTCARQGALTGTNLGVREVCLRKWDLN